jgi:hypothetical protein
MWADQRSQALTKSYRLSFIHSPSTPWKLGESSAPRLSTLLYQLRTAYSKTSAADLLTVLEEALPDRAVSPSTDAAATALTEGLDHDRGLPLGDTLAGAETQRADPPQPQPDRPLAPAGRALLERLHSPPDQVDWEDYKRWGDAGRLFAREVGLKPGENGIVLNGRVSGRVPWTKRDFLMTLRVHRYLGRSIPAGSPRMTLGRSLPMRSIGVWELPLRV